MIADTRADPQDPAFCRRLSPKHRGNVRRTLGDRIGRLRRGYNTNVNSIDTRQPDPEPFSFPIRVYYEDTDAAGVVYYANYLRFCERARTEYLRTAGFSQQTMRTESGLVFVVTRVEADYLRGAELDELLTVASVVERISRASLVFRQTIWRSDTKLFDCRVTIACMALASKRPQRLPETVRALFAAANPGSADSSNLSAPDAA